MNKNYWELYLERFQKFKGLLSIVGTILIGAVFWFFSPDSTISLGIIIPVGLLLIILLFPLISLSFLLYRKVNDTKLPEVLTVEKFPSGDTILLLSQSDLFSHNSIVSIYAIKQEEFEHLIGFGTVINIQENGKIQVGIHSIFDGNDDIVNKIENRDSGILKDIIVKPNTSSAFLKLKD